MKEATKVKTIDEVCGKPAGSFRKYLEEKSAYLKRIEQERQARIKAARTKDAQ